MTFPLDGSKSLPVAARPSRRGKSESITEPFWSLVPRECVGESGRRMIVGRSDIVAGADVVDVTDKEGRGCTGRGAT
jgi:hypothetical protein